MYPKDTHQLAACFWPVLIWLKLEWAASSFLAPSWIWHFVICILSYHDSRFPFGLWTCLAGSAMIRFGNAFISVIVIVPHLMSPHRSFPIPIPIAFWVQLCVHLPAVGSMFLVPGSWAVGRLIGSLALWCHNLAEISIDLAAASRNALPLIDTQCIWTGVLWLPWPILTGPELSVAIFRWIGASI